MKQFCLAIFLAGAVAGCAQISVRNQEVAPVDAGNGQIRPQARPTGGQRPPATARTAAQFDTTTAAERKAAEAAAKAAKASGAGRRLGLTVASLGDPTEPGLWLKTPLVSKASTGRVVYPANGRTVQVDLIPIDGPATAGSRMSLAALRVIEAPLTGLPEVEVFAD